MVSGMERTLLATWTPTTAPRVEDEAPSSGLVGMSCRKAEIPVSNYAALGDENPALGVMRPHGGGRSRTRSPAAGSPRPTAPRRPAKMSDRRRVEEAVRTGRARPRPLEEGDGAARDTRAATRAPRSHRAEPLPAVLGGGRPPPAHESPSRRPQTCATAGAPGRWVKWGGGRGDIARMITPSKWRGHMTRFAGSGIERGSHYHRLHR